MENKRAFKGIWIPKEIWLCENLTMQEKIFLVEIDSLDNEAGCTAGNQYFADFFEISKTRVSIVIQNLIKKGYIKSKLVYQQGTKQILYRVLNICCPPYPTNVIEGIQQNNDTPTQQKLKDNNTSSFNNTNNKERKKESTYDSIVNSFTSSLELREAIFEFIKMRKLIKKPLTDKGLQLMLAKLGKIGNGEAEQIEILNNSITGCWQGIFPLKEENQDKPRPNDITKIDYEDMSIYE